MIEIGVQTKNIVEDKDPAAGFEMLKEAGFTCCDFSLNAYMHNADIYNFELNHFFDRTSAQLEAFFARHKKGAQAAGVRIGQMHMPYPLYVPQAAAEINTYLMEQVAPKSMEICRFFDCPYIVVHGFKLAQYLDTEEAEWQETERFLDTLAPMAKELKITICIENVYNSIAGHIVEGPCCDAQKAAQRIDRFNEKYGAEVLGFCFDMGHANLLGIDPEAFIVTLGNRLKVLHIHDNDGISDLHQIPFTFTASRANTPSTDWEGFLRGLARVRFDKVLSFETAPVLSAFPVQMKQTALRFIADIGKYFVEQLHPIA